MPTANQTPRAPADLRRIRLFKKLDDAQLAVVWAAIHQRPTASKEVIPAGDGLCDNVGFAWSGAYRVVMHAPPPGPQLTVRDVNAGEHFGEILTFSTMPDFQYYLAVDQGGVLLMMPRPVFTEIVHSMRQVCEGVLRSLSQAAAVRADRLFEFATMDVRLRLLAEILRLSKAAKPSEGKVVLASPTHAALAVQVGTTREGVGRHLRAFEREGLLQWRRGQIEILRPEYVREIVLNAAGPRPSYIGDSSDKAH